MHMVTGHTPEASHRRQAEIMFTNDFYPPHPDPPPDVKFPALIAGSLIALLIFTGSTPVAHAQFDSPIITAGKSASQSFIPPVLAESAADILRPFDAPAKPWSSAHRGIDLPAPLEGEVVSPASGTVKFVGQVVDRPVITIEHDDGLLSSFEPVHSELEVGDPVSKGQIIGTIEGQSNHCSASCVHWGVRIPDAWKIGATTRDLYIDPAFLLGWTGPSVLWPLNHDPY